MRQAYETKGRRKVQKRATGVLALGWACFESAATGRTEHRPTSEDYDASVVRRTSFTAGAGLGWKISALETPREMPAPWKIVVITGAPSWAEYWVEVLAALPADREMVVVDRPGFAGSEPFTCVPDIRLQAQALMPVLQAAPGQKVLLVGQSYGAAIAALMARQADPKTLGGVVMLSSFLGEMGPTARWLVDLGAKVMNLIPKDLRHAVQEVSGQAVQLTHLREALAALRMPVHLIHGDADDFAPIHVAEQFAAEAKTRHPVRFERVAGANHFMNDGPPEDLLAALEACIPTAPAKPAFAFTWPKLKLPLLSPRPEELATA
jgi:pimeloyl-ACP methyl ester carboxylesterase